MSKCGKNRKMAFKVQSSVSLLFDICYDPLLNR